MTKKILAILGSLVIVVAVYMAYSYHNAPSLLGLTNQCASGQTCLPSLELTGPNSGVTNAFQVDSGSFAFGANGTSLSQIIDGNGSIIGNKPVTASTTVAFDIAVTGVVSGDRCIAQAASTTQTLLGFSIVGCSASTTSGFITLLVANATGASAVVPYPIASSTHYFITR